MTDLVHEIIDNLISCFQIDSLTGLGVVKVECGSQFSVALTKSGAVYTWYVQCRRTVVASLLLQKSWLSCISVSSHP